MTAREPFTKAKVRRAIEAAQEAGLRVVGVRVSDGVVLLERDDAPVVPGAEQKQDAPATSWDDR